MKIAVVASSRKRESIDLLPTIKKKLDAHGISTIGPYLIDELQEKYQTDYSAIRKELEDIDCMLSIGGDGSLLKLAHIIGLPLPPFVGINAGSLGFLSEISLDQLDEGLFGLITGSYQKTSRIVLESQIQSQQSDNRRPAFAINECAIHRGSEPHLIDIVVHVDGCYLNTFSCDGLIISTPSGSTAYSLAAGGPILTPELQAVVITPICPHTISNKPIVLLPKKSIQMESVRGGSFFDLSFDGQTNFHIEKNRTIEISVSSYRFTTLSPDPKADYFHTVRTKLGWSGSLRR